MVSAVRQAVMISVVVVVVGLVFNAVRRDGIPLIADPETFRIQTDAEFLGVDDAYGLFEEGKAVFVDARDARIFSIERIEGAVSVPPEGLGIDDIGWLSSLDSDIICYATEESQRQAGVVADKLIEMGAEMVLVLHGGIEAWKAAGYPTETD
jgi:rhodanese-related sulfurtransferase